MSRLIPSARYSTAMFDLHEARRQRVANACGHLGESPTNLESSLSDDWSRVAARIKQTDPAGNETYRLLKMMALRY